MPGDKAARRFPAQGLGPASGRRRGHRHRHRLRHRLQHRLRLRHRHRNRLRHNIRHRLSHRFRQSPLPAPTPAPTPTQSLSPVQLGPARRDCGVRHAGPRRGRRRDRVPGGHRQALECKFKLAVDHDSRRSFRAGLSPGRPGKKAFAWNVL